MAASITALVLLEYIALARLLHTMFGVGVRRAELGIGVAFIVATALSLIDPEKFYGRLAPPSLVALLLSQLIVFAVYPAFRKKLGKLTVSDVGLATASAALMLYGLHVALSGVGGS